MPSSEHTKFHTGALLCLILIVAFFVRIISFTGYQGSDDGVYAKFAHQMANGNFKINTGHNVPVFSLRVGLFAPAALCLRVFGTSEWAAIIYPFALSMLGVVLAFFAGGLFWDLNAGLVAAALQAILPLDAQLASLLLPDLPAGFWANLALVLIFYASRSSSICSKIICAGISGLALAASWLCKESVCYLLPFLVVYLIWIACHNKQNIIIMFATGLTFLAVVFIESFVYYQNSGDWLHRFHETERNYHVCKGWFFTEGSKYGWTGDGYYIAVIKRLFVSGPRKIFLTEFFGPFMILGIVAIGYAVMKRVRTFIFPGVWFLFIVAMFNFGSSSIVSYRPLVLNNRYLYPILFPGLILSAGFICDLFHSQKTGIAAFYRRRQLWVVLLFLGSCAACTLGIYKNIKAAQPYKAMRSIAQQLTPDDVVFTDSSTTKLLDFYWKYPPQSKTMDFAGMDAADIPKGAYVFINRIKADFLNKTYGYVLPKFYDNLPARWQLKLLQGKGELYWVP